MALYRLDYATPSGAVLAPVKDAVMTSSDFLSRHAATARKRAIVLSAIERDNGGRCILVTRIGNAGQMKPTLLVYPGGRAVATDRRGRPLPGGGR